MRSVAPYDAGTKTSVGGDKFLLFNAEYYFDVFGPLRLLLFFDAGQAYAPGQGFNWRTMSTSTGVEARFTMPVLNVPFRLIYAWNPNRDFYQPATRLQVRGGHDLLSLEEKTVMRRAAPRSSCSWPSACLTACSAPTSSTPTLDVTLTSNPDPATASGPTGVQYKVTNADDSVSFYEYDYRTSFTVTIQENGGTALDVTALNLTVQQATGGIVITPSGGDQIYFKFNSSAPTNRINANGSADDRLRRLVRPSERRPRGPGHRRLHASRTTTTTSTPTPCRSRSRRRPAVTRSESNTSPTNTSGLMKPFPHLAS